MLGRAIGVPGSLGGGARGLPAAGDARCDTPIDKILAFGRDRRITGTPTIFFEDGERLPGAMSVAQFEKRLGEAAAAVAKGSGAKGAGGAAKSASNK